MTEKYEPDQAAVDWARGRVERAIAKCKDFEAKQRAKGNDTSADRYRMAAFMMNTELIGHGCVIGPFNKRAPEIMAVLRQVP